MASTPSIFRDSAGNLRELKGERLLAGSGAVTTAIGSAAAAVCTLSASTGYRWVVDEATVCVASIAANTAVIATLTDGTTTMGSYAFSTNGKYDLAPQVADSLRKMSAASTAVYLTTATGGTGSTVTITLAGHKVVNADV